MLGIILHILFVVVFFGILSYLLYLLYHKVMLLSGTFFNIAFEKRLRNLQEKINKIRPENEQCYAKTTNPPKELIIADDSNFRTFK